MITLVVAAARNGVIGHDGDLPWRLPDDLKQFKTTTMGRPIVMGRKTYEAIGRPLPGRRNIVISRSADFDAPGCDVVASPQEAVERAGDGETMIIGGGAIYRAFLDMADRIVLTEVHAEVDGDTTFPALDRSTWQEVSREHHPADERHRFAFDTVDYRRRSG
jgi:dihydrofolate reductase